MIHFSFSQQEVFFFFYQGALLAESCRIDSCSLLYGPDLQCYTTIPLSASEVRSMVRSILSNVLNPRAAAAAAAAGARCSVPKT